MLSIAILVIMFILLLFLTLVGAAFVVVWVTHKVGGPYEYDEDYYLNK